MQVEATWGGHERSFSLTDENLNRFNSDFYLTYDAGGAYIFSIYPNYKYDVMISLLRMMTDKGYVAK